MESEVSRKPPKMNVGSASLVVIFAVLCLTVFAVLSFTTANSERNLAEKGAQAVRDYYAADTACGELAATWRTLYEEGAALDAVATVAEAEGATARYEGDALYLAYSRPLDEGQKLDVELAFREGRMEILRWMVVASSDWVPQDSMVVWDGE